MALDEPKENDETIEVDGLTYVVDKELLERVQPITVTLNAMGFYVAGHFDAGRRPSTCSSCG